MPTFITVPWFDSAEWLRVYSALFPPSATAASKRAALSTLLAWKARQPTLVSGIESTLSLLEVEMQSEYGTTCERVLRLAYSAALMRFVNHMLDSEQARGLTLYHAARRAELPDWVIDLRHSAAHGDSLPSFDLLRRATCVALDWLLRNYWDPQKESIADYSVGGQTISRDNENRLSRMISFCASLSICSRAEPRIKKLAEIPDEDMRESIVQEARDLFDSDIPDPSNVSLYEIVDLVNSRSSKLLKSNDASSIVNRTLLGESSLFLSLEVLSIFDEKLFNKNGLNKLYVSSWDVLLTFLQTNNLLPGFVEDLVAASNDLERPDDVRKLAALWTREILAALRRTKMYIAKLKKLNKLGKFPENLNKKKKHKLLFKKLFPSEKQGLNLSLTHPVPEELCSFAYVRPIITSYNPYLVIFIRDLLALLEPRIGIEKEEKLYKLATVIAGKDMSSNIYKNKVFTIDEVNSEHNISSNGKQDDADSKVVEDQDDNEGDWKLASTEYDWSKCPLGVLPWQIKTVS